MISKGNINPRLFRVAMQGGIGRQTPKSTDLATLTYAEIFRGLSGPQVNEVAEDMLTCIGKDEYLVGSKLYGELNYSDMVCILREIMPRASENIRKKIVLELVVHDL